MVGLGILPRDKWEHYGILIVESIEEVLDR
jgi:hypothetical protein